ncbi:uncharacterized protein J3R85_018467 [Psidium guajava]|nr:uncharacterized protein J3R85_018467 [Psidium guajava]
MHSLSLVATSSLPFSHLSLPPELLLHISPHKPKQTFLRSFSLDRVFVQSLLLEGQFSSLGSFQSPEKAQFFSLFCWSWDSFERFPMDLSFIRQWLILGKRGRDPRQRRCRIVPNAFAPVGRCVMS